MEVLTRDRSELRAHVLALTAPQLAERAPSTCEPAVDPGRTLPRKGPLRNGRRRAERRRTVRVVWATVLVVLFGAWMFTLRPQGLGGPAGYVMVRGVSMLPTFETGDLVIARPQRTYRVGDIVAYHVPEGEVGEGIVVIHRIIGGSARAGFVLEGDNNEEPDEWRPKPADIIGTAWIHIPRLARVLAFLHAPVPLASLATGVAAAIILVPGKKTRQRHGTSGRRRATSDA